jgi:hypothetical protein
MGARAAIGLLQGGRAAIGAALLVAPVAAGEPWVGEEAETPGGQVLLRALGARDLVLGLAAVRAARRGDAGSVAGWCAALAACDIVDGVATGSVRSELPSGGVPVMALAFGAAAAGLVLAAKVGSASS